MPLTIRFNDPHRPASEIEVADAADIFLLVEGAGCAKADVLVDASYAFSIRVDEFGVWSIYRRDHRAPLAPASDNDDQVQSHAGSASSIAANTSGSPPR